MRSLGRFAAFLLLVLASAAVGQPKNVILFIGDGMGPEQVYAAECYLGGPIFFNDLSRFPYTARCTTDNYDEQLTDSAAAGSAIATGQKTHNGVISLHPESGAEMETLLERYKSLGRKTGLISTVYIEDATPAAFGAHNTSRSNMGQIASDYVGKSQPNVIFGGTNYAGTYQGETVYGDHIVTTLDAMLSVPNSTEYVCGQFANGSMPYEYDGYGSTVPHLSQMTSKALDILSDGDTGFFLMVEGGRIDKSACHENNIMRTVHEVIEFGNGVEAAYTWAADRSDTLIIVTADHETGGLTVLSDNGAGNYPGVDWSTGGHTNANVPVYAWGLNAELVSSTAGADGVMDNDDFFGIVTAAPANRAPVAEDDEIQIAEGSTWVSLDVLANDHDPDGDAIGVTGVSSASGDGSVAVSENGDCVEFQPAVRFAGTETFTYTISDGTDATATATVTVTVANVTAVAQSVSMPEDADTDLAITLEASHIVEGTALAYYISAWPAHGTLTDVGADGFVTGAVVNYRPDSNFHGVDTFTFGAADEQGSSDTADVTVTVTPVNDPPAGVADEYATEDNTVLAVAAAQGVLANDTDADGDTSLSALLVAEPLHGTLNLESDGSFSYAPAPNFSGSDTFSYRAVDEAGALSSETLVTIAVDFVNDPPHAPMNLTAAEGNGSVELDWADNQEVEGDLAGYRLYRVVGEEAPSLLTPALLVESRYLDTGLQNDVTYTYSVVAVDTVDGVYREGAASHVDATPMTPDYDAYVTAASVLLGSETSSSLPNTVANDGAEHVVAESPDGKAGASGLDVTYALVTPVDAASVFSLQLHCVFSWTASDADETLDVAVYQGQAADGSELWAPITVAGSDLIALDPSCLQADGGQYVLYVRFTDGGSNDGAIRKESKDTLGVDVLYAHVVAVTADDTAPPAPAPTPVPGSDATATIQWEAVAASDVAGYRVYTSDDSGVSYTFEAELGTAETSYKIFGTAGMTYYYAVTAFDLWGNESTPSEGATSVTLQDTAPAAPEGLAAEPGDGEVTLDWADNPEVDIKGYNVYRDAGSGYELAGATMPVVESLFVDSGLLNGQEYFYKVTAVDTGGNESEAGAPVSATPEAAPTEPGVWADSVVLAIKQAGKNSFLQASVTVTDGSAAIEGAVVTGSWRLADPAGGTLIETVTGISDAAGVASLSEPKVESPGTYYFSLDDIESAGRVYDAASNVSFEPAITVD